MRRAAVACAARAFLLALLPHAAARAQALGWTGTVEANANLLFGAASGRVAAASASAAKADSLREVRGDVHWTYADQRDAEDRREVRARATRASAAVDLRPFARVTPFAFASVETSLQQRLAHRESGGAGAKFTYWRRGDDDVSVSLALLAEGTRALDPAPDVDAYVRRIRWSLRGRVRRQLTPSLRLTHVTFYQPAVDRAARYTVDSNTALALAVTRAFAFTLTLRERYDSEARRRGARSNHDGQLLFGARASI